VSLEINLSAPPDAPVLSAFMGERNADASLIMGPLGSGKTFGCIQRILAQACEQEPNAAGERLTRWYAVRNTYIDIMKHGGGGSAPTFYGHFKLADGTICKPEVVFLALDRVEHIKKLRGSQPTGFWFNEVKELLHSIVVMGMARVGRYPSMAAGGVKCTWQGILADTNAPDTDHWYWRLAEEDAPEGWKFFRQPGGVLKTERTHPNGRMVFDANPDAENLCNLPDGYYRRGMAAAEDDWISVNLANEYGFCVDGKPIHPGYVDSIHCLDEEPDYQRLDLRIGIDFGRTPAAAIIHFDRGLGRHVCIDEFCVEDMSASLFGPELKRYLDKNYPGEPVNAWGDPAGHVSGQTVEITPLDMIRTAGIPIQPAPSNSPVIRRSAISVPLQETCMDGKHRLLISPKAKMIRKGLMGGFCYRRIHRAGEERYTEEPDKNQYSHPVEALEYGLLGSGEYHRALTTKVAPARGRGAGRPRRALTA
jgi:hypothetical protein